MIRRLLNIAFVLSLLLVPAILALWIVSYFPSKSLSYSVIRPAATEAPPIGVVGWPVRAHEVRIHSIAVVRGRLRFIVGTEWLGPPGSAYQTSRLLDPTNSPTTDDFLGVTDSALPDLTYDSDLRYPSPVNVKLNTFFDGNWLLVIPLWFIAGILAILPVKRFVGYRKRVRQLAIGHCRVCGYDLRASKERCPECGTPIPQKLGALE
jgi:hypothetical protein